MKGVLFPDRGGTGRDHAPTAPNDPPGLVRINTATGLVEALVPLETTQQYIGAPSLDTEYNVIHVGSEGGVLYAVRLPF